MSLDVKTYLNYILITIALLGLIFVLLWLVGYKKNKEFKTLGAAAFANHKLAAHDIVLLTDGRRVTLTEALDDGVRFHAETLADYGKRPERLTITTEEIVKIEYYGS